MGYTKDSSGLYLKDNKIITSEEILINNSPVKNLSSKYLKFINTRLFSEAALTFSKYGYYTNAPKGTRAYDEYWDEQEYRCLNGYSIGGTRITGEHYSYLNFARIKATVIENGKERKRLGFPRFLDMDYYYYNELELAERDGEGMIVAKSRRKGFSFKNAWGTIYKQKFFRESLCIIGAYLETYSDATMKMALEMADFLNQNTDWARRRLIDTQSHIQDGYEENIQGIKVRKGYKSEIMTMTFKDNPSKSIGKTADRMLFEEAGKWPKLIEAHTLSAPLFKDGEIRIGTDIIFGTGGDMDSGTRDFSEMFYSPRAYGLRCYHNIYDENAVGDCGLFIDEMWYRLPHVDNEGNSNREDAEKSVDADREIKKDGKSKSAYEKFITQGPKTPREAFLITSGNVFPTVAINEHIGYLKTHKEAEQLSQIGRFVRDENGRPKWRLDPSLQPCSFPTKDGEETGCVVIWEHPPIDTIPVGLYIGGIDPYDHDQSSSGSLGSIIIYKRFSSFGTTYHWPVAEYTGRPDRAEEFYENCRMLLEYYNSKALFENEKINILAYFKTKHCEYMLIDQPSIIDKMVKKSTVNRNKGIHMVGPIKHDGELALRDWLKEEYAPGRMNLTKIYSIPLLEELLSYNDTGNFDRVMAFMMVMFYNMELHNERDAEVKENTIKDDFFERKHFLRTKNY